MTPVLDARPSLDPKNSDYPVRMMLDTVHPRSYSWNGGTAFDQNIGCPHCGHKGGCTGHAAINELAARPFKIAVPSQQLAWDYYHENQKVDEYPGEGYEGSSINAAMKTLRAHGHLAEWRWAKTLEEGLVAVSFKGPALIGIPWHTGMFTPDSAGYIYPTGKIEGWHAILWPMVSVTRKDIGLHNSWGSRWGVGGRARMHWEDFRSLVEHQHADVAIPIGRKRVVLG